MGGSLACLGRRASASLCLADSCVDPGLVVYTVPYQKFPLSPPVLFSASGLVCTGWVGAEWG